MISPFPELGKTKPVNSKTRFLMLKPQNIWSDFSQPVLEITFQSYKWREGNGQGSCKGDSLDPLLGGTHPGFLPLFLSFSLCLSPFLTPTPFPLSPAPTTADGLGMTPSWLESKRRVGWKSLQGLSLRPWWWKDSVNLNSFSQENSGLCLLMSETLRTLNGAGLKVRISDLSKASGWIERLGHGHSCRSEAF